MISISHEAADNLMTQSKNRLEAGQMILTSFANIDDLVQNIDAALQLAKNTENCLFLEKSIDEKFSFKMGAGDCNDKRSSIVCRKGPLESAYSAQPPPPPRFPCRATNNKSRKKREANRERQDDRRQADRREEGSVLGGKTIITAEDRKRHVILIHYVS